MSDNAHVLQLLTAALESDRTPDEVCGEYPELLPEVRRRWEECQRMIGEIDMLFPMSDTPADLEPALARYRTNHVPQIPGYELGPTLGRGGMGVVYQARHLGLNRTIALKMLLAGPYASSIELARFLREARAIAGLKHPNLVQVHDVGAFDGRPFYTMELVDGDTLAEKLANTPQAASEAAAMLIILADAVEAAHRGGIVHRDLKPSNILLTLEGVPKISDFGLARHYKDKTDLTRSGARVGTPSYMAPEQVTNRYGEVGPRADLYSLGAILYEMLTGRPPFRAETAADTERQLISDEPVAPSRLNSSVPRDLETICLKCLRKDPTRRYETASALARDLERFQKGEPILARPVNAIERTIKWARRRPAQAILLVTTLMITVGSIGGALWFFSARSARTRAVNTDLKLVEDLQRQRKWDEARNALLRAGIDLGTHGPDELHRQMDEDNRNLDLVGTLDAIKLRHANDLDVGDSYAPAFKDAGFEMFGNDKASVASRIKNSPIHLALTDAIDDWVFAHEPMPKRQWLLEVAQLSDQNLTVWRRNARNILVSYDKAALAKVIATAPIADEPVSFLVDLGWEVARHKEDAIPFLIKVQQQYPNDFWANAVLAYAEGKAGNKADAIRYFQAALVLRPNAAIAENGLSWALAVAGRSDEAVVHGRNAVRLDPSVAASHVNFGTALTKVGRNTEALEQFQLAVKLAPNEMLPHMMLGQLLDLLGRKSEAMDEFHQAMVVDPTQTITDYKFLATSKEVDPLNRLWLVQKKSLDANPPDHTAWNGYLELCLYLGHEDEYRSARTRLLARFGNTTDPHVAERIGRACLLLPASEEETQKAVALIDRAVNADKSTVEAWAPDYFQVAKALAEFRQGHLQSATEILHGTPSLVLKPMPQLMLAMIQQKQGKTEDARKTLKATIQDYDWKADKATDADAWMFHVLRRQAEKIIGPSTLPSGGP